MLKLQVLVQLINPDNVQTLLREFKVSELTLEHTLALLNFYSSGLCA